MTTKTLYGWTRNSPSFAFIKAIVVRKLEIIVTEYFKRGNNGIMIF